MLIDIALVALIAAFAFAGKRKGLFKSLAGILCFAVSAALVYFFSKDIIELAKKTALYDAINEFVGKRIAQQSALGGVFLQGPLTELILKIFVAVLIFVLVRVLILVIDRIFHLPVLKTFNKFGGLVFGLIQGFLIVYIIFAVWGSTTLFTLPKELEGTTLAKSVFENNLLMILFI